MEQHEQFMRQAIELATENVVSGRGGPFGAVIVKGGDAVATGTNLVTSSCDATAHAEITAIRNACKALNAFELRGCTIYSSCEPCPMCLAAIFWARCDGLYFGNTAADASEAGFDDSRFLQQVCTPNEKRDLAGVNLLRAEALASFAAWREYTERIGY